MQSILECLYACPLFAGIPGNDQGQVLHSLHADRKTYSAFQFLLHAGDPVEQIGIVLDGRVQVIQEDFSGNRTILTELAPGELFAEAFACSSQCGAILPVSVFSVSESSVLWIDYRWLVQPDSKTRSWHPVLIRNMLAILADKNQLLGRRIRHLSKRTTRDKLLSFLTEQATTHKNLEFSIPFSRQELADYLCVERSAMSSVLSSLQKEGVLEVSRRKFKLKIIPYGENLS